MKVLWRWISLRHLFHEAGWSLLTLLGVALGVGVVVSIRLANTSALASFAETVDSVAGRANLQVTADSDGFDERLFPRVRDTPGVEAAAPVVQTYALARLGTGALRQGEPVRHEGPYNETLLVLGVDPRLEQPFGRYTPPKGQAVPVLDFLFDPYAVAITRSLATRHGLRLGSPLSVMAAGRQVTLHVRLIIDSQELQQAMGGNVLLMGLGAAQGVFQRYGRIDRIDLIVRTERRDAVRAALRPLLPANVEIDQPQGRTKQVENMLHAFELSLSALSFIALFVAMFLIFNAVSMSVLRRRRETGILRSLGVTRRQVLAQFLVEGLALGVVGSTIGLLLGTLMARLALASIARTISNLYLVTYARDLRMDPATYATGFALGVAAALFSCLAPALEASRTAPGVTISQGMFIEAQPLPIGRWSAAAFGLIGASALVALWTVSHRHPLGGFASAALLLAGFSLLAPGFTLVSQRAAAPAAGLVAGIEGVLGARYLREAVARASVVVAALMVSVGMLVGLSIMVASFRNTVSLWVNQTLRGDLYVEPVGRRVTGSATVLPPEVIEAARSIRGVAAVDTYRAIRVDYGGRIAYVVAVDLDIQGRFGRLQFMQGDTYDVFRRAREHDGVVVTESFGYRHHVSAGDRVTLKTPSGTVRLPVEGVFYDYSTDAGAILMDYRLFARLWNDTRAERLAIYVDPGVDADRVRTQFIQAVGDRVMLHVTPNHDLRARVLEVFDQTFQITYALQAIAIMVAILGVISTLTALILQRGREIAVLRAVGALRRQVQKMVLVESVLLGLIGGLLGCACGLGLSILLIHVINKQFFGWSIRMTVAPGIFLQAVALMVVTALLAGIGPARLAATRVAASAMRME